MPVEFNHAAAGKINYFEKRFDIGFVEKSQKIIWDLPL